jgi:acetyl esterase/lipase
MLHHLSALIISLCLFSSYMQSANPAKTILLWPNGAPGALGDSDQDKPTLNIYLPDNQSSNAAVLVLPGGGYEGLSLDSEGIQPAQWLNRHGIAAFVLHYRISPKYHYPAMILDGARAMRCVRAHALEFNVDPNRIGIWGFSAGGHLASSIVTHFDAGQKDAADPIDRVSDRPDFAILAYAVISLDAAISHPHSRSNFLGSNSDPTLEKQFSNEMQVKPNTPPCFLFHTGDDSVVPVENSVRFYEALKKAGVPVELHIFEQGEHGIGLAQTSKQLQIWPALLEEWMRLHGWI